MMLQPVDGTPMADEMPEEMKQHILHSALRKGDLLILASDMAREELTTGNRVALMVECQSEEEIRSYYNNLSRGGEIVPNQKFQIPNPNSKITNYDYCKFNFNTTAHYRAHI